MQTRVRLAMRIAAVLAVAALLSPALAEPTVRVFDNGATAIVDEVHSAPVAAVRLYVKTGSIYEQEFLGGGITHYLEHLVGRGSKKRTTEEIEHLQEELGNQTNAYTSNDHTCYHITSSARFVDLMVDLLVDYVFSPTFGEEDVENQREIILREMAMGDDEPEEQVYDLLNQTMFLVHPERYRVIGYPEPFKQITRENLFTYHSRMYTTDNVVLVVAGDIETDAVMATVEATLGSLPRMARVRPSLPQEPRQTTARRAEQVVPTLAQAYLSIGYRTVPLSHPDLYPLDVLAYVLANGPSSRLISDLRDERGLVHSASCYSYTPAHDAGRFVVEAVMEDARVAEAEEAILKHLQAVCEAPVTEAELTRAKRQKQAELVYARSSIEGWASTLGSDYMSTGDVAFSRHYVEGIGQVTAAEVQRVAQQYLRVENSTVAIRRPGAGASGDRPATARAPRPVTERSQLPNGITLLLRADSSVPMVNVQASFMGGLRYETAAKAGIGNTMAQLLKWGTPTRSRREIATALDDMGASLRAASGRNSLNVSAACLSEDLSKVLPIMADCIRNPAFRPEDVERIKQLTLASIQAQQDDVEHIAAQLMLANLFPGHPYGLDASGTPESVSAIDPAALREHHALVCNPARMVLAICGDVDPGAARALVEQLFGDWRPETVAAPPVMAQEFGAEKRLVQERPQEQAILYIGFPGLAVAAEDRFAFDVMDAVFSGIYYPGGRLHGTLRGAGQVYFTHLYPMTGLEPGAAIIVAGTEPAQAAEVEATIRRLVTEIQTGGITEEELNRGRKMCISALEVQLGSPGDKIAREASDELYGLGFGASAEYASHIETVTAAQVQQAALKYMDLSRAVTVLTRPPADSAKEE